MPSPQVAYSLSCPVYGGTPVAAYTLMVQDSSGYYLPATTANRALWGRVKMMATSAYAGAQAGIVSGQHVGPVDSGLSLGAGAADRCLRPSAAGGFEVFTPVNGGSSDIVGWADATGAVTLALGQWTETRAAGGGGGGSPGGSNGDLQVNNAGAFAGLSPGASGNVPVSNGTTFASGALPIASTSGTLAVARGGTGQTSVPGADNGTIGSILHKLSGLIAGAASILTDGVRFFFGSGSRATTGFLRWPASAAEPLLAIRNFADNDDIVVLYRDPATNNMYLGTASSFATTSMVNQLFIQGNALVSIGAGGVATLIAQPTTVNLAKPLAGYGAGSFTYRRQQSTITMASSADRTLASTEYESPHLIVTGSPGAVFNIIGADQAGAEHTVTNTTAFALAIKKSGGTGVTIAAGKSAYVRHNGTDYIRLTPDA